MGCVIVGLTNCHRINDMLSLKKEVVSFRFLLKICIDFLTS